MNTSCKCCEETPKNVQADVNVRVIVGPIVTILASLVTIIAAGKLLPPDEPKAPKPQAARHVARKLEVVPVANGSEKEDQEEKKKNRVYPLIPDEKGIRE